MKKYLVVIIRNDSGQVLLFEKENSFGFLSTELQASQSIFNEATKLASSVGLRVGTFSELGGVHRIPGAEIQGLSTYVVDGRLPKFPQGDLLSASWIAPSLALKIPSVNDVMRHFLEKMTWV